MTENVQVLVAGGGVAGSMAAIAAARLGSSVALIERGGCLGGMWTAGLVGFTLDSGYKTGLLSEFLKRVHGELETGVGTIFEVQKAVLEAMCAESGVSLYYHSQVNHIETENRRIIKAEVISKSGNIEFIPESVIDATADGDIAVMAGCEYSYGRASDGKAQPMSMIALISGLDEKAEKYISRPTKDFWEARKPLKELFDSIGAEYSIGCPSIQPLCSGIYILSVNQEYGYSGCNVKELTAATVHARNEI